MFRHVWSWAKSGRSLMRTLFGCMTRRLFSTPATLRSAFFFKTSFLILLVWGAELVLRVDLTFFRLLIGLKSVSSSEEIETSWVQVCGSVYRWWTRWAHTSFWREKSLLPFSMTFLVERLENFELPSGTTNGFVAWASSSSSPPSLTITSLRVDFFGSFLVAIFQSERSPDAYSMLPAVL